MKRATLVAVSFALLVSAVAVASAKDDASPPAFRLAKIFADGMVFQQDKPIRVWGFAPAGAKVSVTLTQNAKVGEQAAAKAGVSESAPRRGQDGGTRDVTVQYVEANPPAPINQTVEATAGDDGQWLVELAPAKGSFRPAWIIAGSGQDMLVVCDVLIGEVWLCAGQSNMAWSDFNRKDREAPSADFPGLRYVQWNDSWYKPLDDLRRDVSWRPCTPESAKKFSAVPYLYGMFLHRYLKVPVGIINVARGGTLGQTWCLRSELDNIDNIIIKTVLKDYDAECAAWDDPKQFEQMMAQWKQAVADAEKKHQQEMAQYEKDLAAAKAEGKTGRELPRKPKKRLPKKPDDPRSGWSPPAGLFNATVMPIRKLSLRGVLYYQGENQAFSLWTRYEHTFPKVPVSMRKAFGDDGLWFGCISQPGWGKFGIDPEISAVQGKYQVVRDIQRRALKNDKLAGMIATYPTGNSYIHPAEKLPVAEYASLWALANAYKKPVEHFGFRYREHKVRDGKVYLYFDIDPVIYDRWKHLESNAAWQVLPYPYQGNAPLEGFTIAGADRRWYPATARHAKLDGKWTIEVSSDLCPEPVAARYGWASWPTGNLVGRNNEPVATFRTDDWPLPESYRYSKEAAEKTAAENAAALLTAEKQALDRKIRQAMIELPRLEAELYSSKLQRDARKLAESKIARAAAAIGELVDGRGPLARTVGDNPELAKKIQAAQKALDALKAEAKKISE